MVRHAAVKTARVQALVYLKRCPPAERSAQEVSMTVEKDSTEENVRMPVMQRVLDNPFLLLFIGVVMPTVFYILWGVMELVTIPVAP